MDNSLLTFNSLKIIYTSHYKLFNMFCDKCSMEIPDTARFCSNCGNQIKKTNKITNEKNMILALFLSILLPGLGLCYAGDKKKGVILFVAILVLYRMRKVQIFLIISIILWIYAIYETYREIKRANGEENPNLLEDIGNISHNENTLPIIAIVLLFIATYFIIRILFY